LSNGGNSNILPTEHIILIILLTVTGTLLFSALDIKQIYTTYRMCVVSCPL